MSGKSKIDIKYIENSRKRGDTFYNRRKGLIKKAHELSVICGVKISIFCTDYEKNCFTYCNDPKLRIDETKIFAKTPQPITMIRFQPEGYPYSSVSNESKEKLVFGTKMANLSEELSIKTGKESLKISTKLASTCSESPEKQVEKVKIPAKELLKKRVFEDIKLDKQPESSPQPNLIVKKLKIEKEPEIKNSIFSKTIHLKSINNNLNQAQSQLSHLQTVPRSQHHSFEIGLGRVDFKRKNHLRKRRRVPYLHSHQNHRLPQIRPGPEPSPARRLPHSLHHPRQILCENHRPYHQRRQPPGLDHPQKLCLRLLRKLLPKLPQQGQTHPFEGNAQDAKTVRIAQHPEGQ